MNPTALVALLLWTSGTFLTVTGKAQSVSAWYGDTIVVPCPGGNPPPEDLMFVKWKIDRSDGTAVDLLVKQHRSSQATIQATDGYAQRVGIDDRQSLLISKASLRDQHTYTCMVVTESNLNEYSVAVRVHKKPSSVEILDESEALTKDKLTQVGTCVAAEANPAAAITWRKDGQPLEADGEGVVIASSTKLDPTTGLSTTSSSLQFSATKADAHSVFTCVSTYEGSSQEVHMDPLPVHYPSEKASLEIVSQQPIEEGDNVTLRCQADGNPPPSSYFFYFQDKKLPEQSSDTYSIPSISREASGEYKCSLPENKEVQASKRIYVNYLDLVLRPSGRLVKTVGHLLTVKVEKNSTSDALVSWTKDGRMVEEPAFSSLTYGDAGVYTCQASMGRLTRSQSLELVVEGSPVITSLTKHQANDPKHQVLVCEAEGFPEPTFKWSISYTNEKSSYANGKAVHNVTVVLQANLTIFCNVSNKLGEVFSTISIHPDIQKRSGEKEDEVAVVVAVAVAVALLLVVTVGIVCWFWRRKSRSGSFRTHAAHTGHTAEETKQLAGNSENV